MDSLRPREVADEEGRAMTHARLVVRLPPCVRFDHVFDLALDCLQSQLGEVTVQVWMGGYPGGLCAWYAVLLLSGYNERACRLLSQSLTTCQTLIKAV